MPFKGICYWDTKRNINEVPNVMCLFLISLPFINNNIFLSLLKIVFVKQANNMATVHNLYPLKVI